MNSIKVCIMPNAEKSYDVASISVKDVLSMYSASTGVEINSQYQLSVNGSPVTENTILSSGDYLIGTKNLKGN